MGRNYMPLTDEEKRCLKVATDFLNDARRQVGFDGKTLLGESALASGGAMLGEIAADKYRDCMKKIPQEASKRGR
jgi:hypothetical protein